MNFNILAVGDVVGACGIRYLESNLRRIKKKYGADFVSMYITALKELGEYDEVINMDGVDIVIGNKDKTKIIDYMLVGKPIVAIGPNEVNSIQVLKKYSLAIVCETASEVASKIKLIKDKKINLEVISNNVFEYLTQQRDIKKIQNGIYCRLENLVGKNEDSAN